MPVTESALPPSPQSSSTAKPLFLLADSQPLFFNQGEQSLIQRIRQQLTPEDRPLQAAYIGAANGDRAEFYDIFTVAMDRLAIDQCHHIKTPMNPADKQRLLTVDLIVLAGGDVALGWQSLKQIQPQLIHAYQAGTVIIGISAGAIHLGQLGWYEQPRLSHGEQSHSKLSHSELSHSDLFSTLAMVPYVIGAHQEQQQWQPLKQLIQLTDGCVQAIGISHGSGLIVHPDHSIEALHKPLLSIRLIQNQIYQQYAWRL